MDRYTAREIVLKSPKISRGARMLYFALDNYQRDQPKCWPSQRTLRDIVGCSQASLKRYLSELVREKLCAVSRTSKGGPNIYVLFHSTLGSQASPGGLIGGLTLGSQASPHKANQSLKPGERAATCKLCEDRGKVRMFDRGQSGHYSVVRCPDCAERKTA